MSKAADKAKADALKAEVEVSAARAKEIEAKNTPEPEVIEEAAEAVTEEAPAVEAVTEEAPAAETPADEEKPAAE